MDNEIESFIKVWIIAITSLCYSYYIASRFPKGILRLISLLPIFYLFIILPLNLHSFHLCGPTSFFLAWLANFKLLLFSFDLGPLALPQPNLFHFIVIASLPIKINQNPPPNSPRNPQSHSNSKKVKHPSQQITQNPQIPSQNPKTPPNSTTHLPKTPQKPLFLAIKALILAMVIFAYNFRHRLHPYAVLALYFCHMYLALEVLLALSAAPVRAIFGFELEPQFNEPYLSTSLQDFWGRRWNLMVPSILRPTVYVPIRRISTPLFGPRWAVMFGQIAAFLVSGLMHELIYFYLARVSPTWEVTWFFVLHGICTAIEVAVKRVMPYKWHLRRAISGPLTLGFLAVTGKWLFLQQLIRNGVVERAISEYPIMVNFVKNILL